MIPEDEMAELRRSRKGTDHKGGTDAPTDGRETQPKSRGHEFGKDGSWNHA